MNKKLEKYLPIGTIVLLKGATKRLMITGFCAVDEEENNKIYDYVGCMYPEGVLSNDETALFNNDQIDKIYFFGLSDNDEKKFRKINKSSRLRYWYV